MKTKKILSMTVIVLLALIVIVALAINIFGDQALKAGVETGASKAMKVDVTLNDISLGILAGKLNMNELVVNNPEGYQHPTFIELEHGFVDLNTKSLLSDTIEIEKMQFDNIKVTIEQKGMTNNLKEILNNLPTAEPSDEPAEDEKAGKKLLIKQLEINGIEVKAKLLPIPGRADTVTLKIKPIHMENIGSDEEIDMPELVSKILLAIAGGIAEQGRDLLPLDMIDSIGDQLSEQGQKILESGKDVGAGIIEDGKDIGKEATEALKGLNPFKKKE